MCIRDRFWPGPLTMILPRRDCVPLRTTGGLDTVGVRCPDQDVYKRQRPDSEGYEFWRNDFIQNVRRLLEND